ncbi:MAG: BatD family protein [Bacteroidota bacterium]
MKNISLSFRWLGFTLLISLPLLGYGESDRFTATVNRSSLSVGEQVQITFTLKGNNQARNFKAPSFQDFNVLMGPSQSTNMQIINGSVSQSISLSYVLQAVKEGTFKIGGAEIMAGNDRLISNGLTLTVTKSAAPNSNNGGSGGGNGTGSADVFLRASVDKRSAYVGEGIVVTYRLYTKVQLLNYSLEKVPSLTGFYSQSVDLPQQPQFHRENMDGVAYDVADIRKLIIFPQRSGNLEIDAMEGEVIARVIVKNQRSNDPFSQFFNDPFFSPFGNTARDVKVALKTQPIVIQAKDLPAGAPSGFQGAVGTFAQEVSLDRTKTKAGDPVALRIRISGKGNLKLTDAPEIELPNDLEAYDPKESSNLSVTGAGVTGSKTFEYLLIPRNGGEYKIPVPAFSYFDLDKKQYVTLEAPELSLEVGKGSGNATTSSGSIVQKSDVQLLGKDIAYIKTNDPVFISARKPFFGSSLFYALVTLPGILSTALVLLIRKRREKESDIGRVRSERASKTALKRLSTAKEFLDKNDRDGFLDEMFKALWGFTSDRLGIPVSDLSRDSASTALQEKGVDVDLIGEFIETTDNCEYARFGGGSGADLSNLYLKGLQVITRLEQSLKA